MNANTKTLITAVSLLVMGVIPGTSIATNADDIQNRVKKVGKLNVSGEAVAASSGESASTTSDNAGGSADPASMYQASCFACHGTGAANAPILGNNEAWAPRIAQGEASLIEHAISGLNAMPPRGGSTLSDDEIIAVVKYMVSNSQ